MLSSILFISSVILSLVIIFILCALAVIACKVFSSILNCNCAAKRIARIILSGSSIKVFSGSRGVLINFLSMSPTPSNGSFTVPKSFSFKLIPSAFMVKSLRNWSSCNVPATTDGLRLSVW